ncbi:MAG: class I SAM-dependent methyltransferase [Calditrichaeota bacterium]|nr:class I SAM-dependent methyltransferase [Calditrichota bacterium]MCB0266683.1 class I SAM-dependent methyltransferase [Calditrichota bacterium]MCB0285167.1 class I SAM-dependent methyltransferase [Calditrichota bacterium]MCB9067255.1 class I SAM-dependent methyltransferase [Calditrichia bacterium]
MTVLNSAEVIRLYRKRAGNYNFTANLYYLIGYREYAYRKKAVNAMALQRGDTVVDIGCGTGLNFPLLQHVVGEKGKIIGVDLTDAMLKRARQRIKKEGWTNVELVQADAATFQFTEQVDGIISTFALSMMPDLNKIVENGASSLSPGSRWVVLDLKMPANWLSRLWPIYVFITRPFGVTNDYVKQRSWETISDAFHQYLHNTFKLELYGGFSYIIVGETVDNH